MSSAPLVAKPVTPENFARYGRVYRMDEPGDTGIISTKGDGWSDGFTRTPLIDGPGHLGMTIGGSAPWPCRAMERHPLTEEALFCAGEAIVLAVAPASDRDAPESSEIEAFVIEPGQAVVMARGVWHDACRGATRTTPYYWMAQCGLGESPWIAVADGPRQIVVGS